MGRAAYPYRAPRGSILWLDSTGIDSPAAQDRGLLVGARRLLEARTGLSLHASLTLGPRDVAHRDPADDTEVRVGGDFGLRRRRTSRTLGQSGVVRQLEDRQIVAVERPDVQLRGFLQR